MPPPSEADPAPNGELEFFASLNNDLTQQLRLTSRDHEPSAVSAGGGSLSSCEICSEIGIHFLMHRRACCGHVVCYSCTQKCSGLPTKVCCFCFCELPINEAEIRAYTRQNSNCGKPWAIALDGQYLIEDNKRTLTSEALVQYKEGIRLIILAAAHDEPFALTEYAKILEHASSRSCLSDCDHLQLFGFSEVDKQQLKQTKISVLIRSAEQGNPEGMLMLAEFYLAVGDVRKSQLLFYRIFSAFGSYCSVGIDCTERLCFVPATQLVPVSATQFLAHAAQKSAYWLAWLSVTEDNELEKAYWYLRKAKDVPDKRGVRKSLVRCFYCSKKAKYLCGSCKCARYCSTACHTANWAKHKSACTLIKYLQDVFEQTQTPAERLDMACMEHLFLDLGNDLCTRVSLYEAPIVTSLPKHDVRRC